VNEPVQRIHNVAFIFFREASVWVHPLNNSTEQQLKRSSDHKLNQVGK